MPSKRMARFNKSVTNHVLGRLAPRMPGFGMVQHRGRKSGKIYRTPVFAFRSEDGYVVALTFSSRADWVQNVLAAGGCDMQTRRRVVQLVKPTVYVDGKRSAMPAHIRAGLALLRVDEFLSLKFSNS